MARNNPAGRRRVAYYLQSHDGTQTDRGQKDNSAEHWDTVATVYGTMDTLSGREVEAAHKLFAEATHRVEIPYRASVTPRQRLEVIATGDLVHIGHVDNPGQKNQKLVLLCAQEV